MSEQLPDDVALMDGVGALPRDNGELVFAAPWDAFRQRLIDAVAEDPDRPYYESWAVALESFVVGVGLTTPAELDAASPSVRPPL